MQKEIKVFVASKQEEFESERKEIRKLISDLKDRSGWNISSIILESKGSDKGGIEKHSLENVAESDILILLLGGDYSEKAEKEYGEAYRLNTERLIYIKELKVRDEKVNKLIERIHDPIHGDKTDPFTDENDLLKKVHLDLGRVYPKLTTKRYPIGGADSLKQYERGFLYRAREFIFLPIEPIKEKININDKYEKYLYTFYPQYCQFGSRRPTQNGVEFGNSEKEEPYARIENNLLVYYSNSGMDWKGYDDNGMDIPYTAKILCGLIEYVKRIYKENKVESPVSMLFNLHNVKGTKLKFSYSRSLGNSTEKNHTIDYTFNLQEGTKDIAVDIINKLYRCFGFSAPTTQEIEKMIEELLKEPLLCNTSWK